MAKRSLVIMLLMAFVMFSTNCSADKDKLQKPVPPVKTKANTQYRPPSYLKNDQTVMLGAHFQGLVGTTHNSGLRNEKFIALTFDDGPHPKNTPRLLEMLKSRNIKATFYVIGSSIDSNPHILKRIVADGHEVGNHTYTHGNLSKMSDAALRRELDRCRDSIGRVTGVQPRTMRPPYGALLTRQREMIMREYGYPTILWDVDPRDWQRPGPSVVTQRILTGTRNGSVVLAHDLHKPTIDAMPATLDGLLRKGYQFVTVSQLLSRKASAQ